MAAEAFRGQVTAAAGSTGRAAALQTLRWAMAWAGEELAGGDAASAEGTVDVAALELAIALDDALGPVADLCRGASAVIRQAGTGAEVEQRLSRRLDELQSVRADVDRIRERLTGLAGAEQALLEGDRERAALDGRVEQLRELQERAQAIPELREQERQLALREQAMRADVDAADEALARTAGRVLIVSRERLAQLGERNRTLLERIAESETAYAEERRRYEEGTSALADALRRYEEFDGIHEDLAAVTAYQQADAELVDVLTAVVEHPAEADVTGAREAMSLIRQRLHEVEDALSRALDVHQRHQDAARRVLRHGEAAATAGR